MAEVFPESPHIPLVLAFLLLRINYSNLIAQVHTLDKDGHSSTAYGRKKWKQHKNHSIG